MKKKIKFQLCFLMVPFVLFSQQEIHFESANPFSFKDIILNIDSQETQSVYGILRMPINFNSQNQYAVVIAVAGSNGWSAHHYEYLEMYREAGIATFELCSFKSRGIESTVGTQVDVTTAMMILDSYRAYEQLEAHPNIKSNKIGITGWSLGGGVALFSAWQPLKYAINKNVQFAAHLPIYPPCIVVPEILDFGLAPIHILIGELDNWTPAKACLDLVNKLNQKNIKITIYPDAHHSFDSNVQISKKQNGYILEDCRFIMNNQGAVLMNFFNIPMTTPLLQKIGLSMCARRGPVFGQNIQAKNKSLLFAREFMNKYLN